ncbi:MAG: hypothetical protein WBB74_05650 [Gaiellaceae bacterium]
MNERNLARELALIATEVDSLAKALVQTKAELAHEAERHRRAQGEANELRQQLRYTRRRAQKAEHEFAKLASSVEAGAHRVDARERELQARLEQTVAANDQLRHEVERKERQRRALEVNLHELMENLRSAAQEVGRTNPAPPSPDEEVTLIRQPTNGEL